MGLGDHIICNGLVRHFAEIHKSIKLFCHPHYKENVEYMYRDDKNITLIPIEESKIPLFLDNFKVEYIKTGFEKLKSYEKSGMTFDEAFYDIADLNFKIRFDKFYIQRDEELEQKALVSMNPSGEDYIYVHDAPERGFKIDATKYRQDLKVLTNNYDYNLFNLRKILENATEIHSMQTGMLDFCNSIVLEKPKIFVHRYVRNYGDFVLSKGINKINLIS